MRTKITQDKIKDIFEKSNLVSNLARRKILMWIIFAMIECKNVILYEISLHIKINTQVNSNLRRIQRFLTQISFNEKVLAQFLLSFFTSNKIILCIDRTNWKIGSQSCNILMITGYFNGLGLPLYWKLLPKSRGNSSTLERIDLMQKCVDLVGIDRINYLIADREFIGNEWFNWLKTKKINFVYSAS